MDSFWQMWFWPLSVFLAGTVLALAVAYRLWRAAPVDATVPRRPDVGSRGDDVDEQLQHCLAHLADVRGQQERLAPTAYQGEVAAYETRAAGLLRERDQLKQAVQAQVLSPPSASTGASPVASFLTARPQLRGALWGGGTVGVAALLYGLVVHEQTPRRDDGVMQGPPPSASTSGAPAAGIDDETQQELQQLMADLEKKRDDVPKLLRLAHILLRTQMLDEAKIVNDRALRYAPDDVEGRVHAAVLMASKGEGAAANQALDALVLEHTDFAEAWFFRGMLALQAGDRVRMTDSFKHFLAVAPAGSQRDRIAAMLKNSDPNGTEKN